MANILIVEDEPAINELMKRTLSLTGHFCFQAYTGMDALKIINKKINQPDLILLDINLPDMDGFQVMEHIRNIPVIYVTARDEVPDRVKGLNSGAEDYIIKPFAMEELVARVQVVLRRFHREENVFVIDDVTVDVEKHKVTKNGLDVELTNREFELLRILLVNINIALSRNQLLDLAWGIDYFGDDRTVDVHIQRLRKKLGFEAYIKTVFKYGYRLEI